MATRADSGAGRAEIITKSADSMKSILTSGLPPQPRVTSWPPGPRGGAGPPIFVADAVLRRDSVDDARPHGTRRAFVFATTYALNRASRSSLYA